jgi:hypothetical protein
VTKEDAHFDFSRSYENPDRIAKLKQVSVVIKIHTDGTVEKSSNPSGERHEKPSRNSEPIRTE